MGLPGFIDDWCGVIAFLVTVITTIFIVLLILRHPNRRYDSSGNAEYDRLVMRTILPKGGGIEIDTVYDNIKDVDTKGFHLSDFQADDNKNECRD